MVQHLLTILNLLWNSSYKEIPGPEFFTVEYYQTHKEELIQLLHRTVSKNREENISQIILGTLPNLHTKI